MAASPPRTILAIAGIECGPSAVAGLGFNAHLP